MGWDLKVSRVKFGDMRWTFALAALVSASVVTLLVSVSAAGLTAGDREMVTAQREVAAVGFVVARAPDPATVAAAFAPGRGLDDGPAGQRIVVLMPDGTRLGNAAALRSAPAVPYRDLARARGQTAAVETGSGGARVVLQPVPAARGGTAVIQYWTPARPWWPLWVLPALVAVAGAAVAGRCFGARQARLVRRFARAAAAVRDGEVPVRIEPAGPAEMRAAARAFTAMSERVVARLGAERRATGDLSHRLRTPLAALRLRVDRLGAGGREDAARAALDRLEQEIDLLIRSSRLPGGTLYAGGCDAAKVVAERTAYWSVLAEDQGRPVRVACPDRPLPVPLDRDRLATALDALIGNVFHHTPEATPYAVTLEPRTDEAVLTVADDGPGIGDPAVALRRGGSGGGSTGLGLDIARRVAEAAGGGLTIGRSPGGGARIELRTRVEVAEGVA